LAHQRRILEGSIAVLSVFFVAATSAFKWVIVASILGHDKETILGKLVYGKILEGDNVGDFDTLDLLLPGLVVELLPPVICTYVGYKVMYPHLASARARIIGVIAIASMFLLVSLLVAEFRIQVVEWYM